MYKKQRSRGTEGFGFYSPDLDRLAHNTSEKRIIRLLKDSAYASKEILFHHRFPTSTENVQNACHPFSTKANSTHFTHQYVLVHNGYISNAWSLKKQHEEMGIKYISEQRNGSFTDSEALLYDVALYLEGKQDKLNAKGMIAFVVKRDDGATYFARNYAPLKYELTSRGLTVRSEGSGHDVKPDTLYEFVADRKAFITKELEIPDYSYPVYKGSTSSTVGNINFSHAMQDAVDPDREYLDYSEAYNLIDTLDTVEAALEFVQGRYDENEISIAKYQAQFIADPLNSQVNLALDGLEEEQETLKSLLDKLWEIQLDEWEYAYSVEAKKNGRSGAIVPAQTEMELETKVLNAAASA